MTFVQNEENGCCILSETSYTETLTVIGVASNRRRMFSTSFTTIRGSDMCEFTLNGVWRWKARSSDCDAFGLPALLGGASGGSSLTALVSL